MGTDWPTHTGGTHRFPKILDHCIRRDGNVCGFPDDHTGVGTGEVLHTVNQYICSRTEVEFLTLLIPKLFRCGPDEPSGLQRNPTAVPPQLYHEIETPLGQIYRYRDSLQLFVYIDRTAAPELCRMDGLKKEGLHRGVRCQGEQVMVVGHCLHRASPRAT